ncbi:unnamed protein product [Orchesella dallaii]|uniref:RRM domain-containing protein n=1 Tax=Orchesella dallaii TaxID=48710 RepID=A0ABP1R2Y4_9HEXA
MSKGNVNKNPIPNKKQDPEAETSSVLWVGNLAENVTESMLYELFLQVGPIKCIKIPKDRSMHKGYCFIQFAHSASVPYAIKVLHGTTLFGKKLKFEPRPDCLDRVPKLISKLFTECPN